MRADLAWTWKTFLDEEVKSIFIEGLGEEFEKILDGYITNSLPAEWQTNNLNELVEAGKKYEEILESKKKLYKTDESKQQ
eukprot:6618735-Ditylum_brightwellii.AAC.1